MKMWVFDGARMNFDRITVFLNPVILGSLLHWKVWNLGNQLCDSFQWMFLNWRTHCRNIEDVHLGFLES